MVVSSRHKHSSDSSSWFLSSFTTQSCMMASVNIFSLKSSPMNLMLPRERRRALSRASSSSSFRRALSSGCGWNRGRSQEDPRAELDYLYLCICAYVFHSCYFHKSLEPRGGEPFSHAHTPPKFQAQLTPAVSSISFCFFSKISSSSLSFSNSFWHRFRSTLRKLTITVGLSVVGTFS